MDENSKRQHTLGVHPAPTCESLLETIVRSMSLLLADNDIDHAVELVLAMLAKAVNVDRAYVFEIHSDPQTRELLCSQRYEWCSPSVEPQIDNPDLQNFPFEQHFSRWLAILRRGDSLSGLVADFPQQERPVLESQNIFSLCVVPILIRNTFWGFIGFDDCTRFREWTGTEELGLKAAAAGIGGAIVRHRAHADLVAAQESLEAKVRERTIALETANLRLRKEIAERRAAEAALKKSESLLRAAMENLPFDFFAIDESGRYVLENAASIRHWGSAIGKRPEDIAQGEILARWQENNCRAFAGETVQGEVRLTRNGKPKYLYNIITPIRIDGAITGILGVNIDITDQKRAELALGRAKEEMQQLVENRTAELTEVNKQLRNEILVREEAQEELHEREQEFRALVENAPDVIIRIDPQLRIVYANPAMQASTGYPREWFLDKSIEEIGLPAHRTRQISKILHSVFDSGQEQTITIEYPAADRSTKHFQLRFSPEHAPGGDRVESVLGIGRDISAMKELEARLRAANTAKNTFMANMSHELRTPLGGILGLVDLALSQDTTLPDDLKHDLNMIHESARSLLYIINDILDLSRIEAGKLELQDRDFDLKEMLELVLEPLAMQARAKGLRFHIELRPEIPPVIRADPFRLGQILKNLVSNAVKFTETGEVLVQVVNRSRPGCERHRLAFSVIDTGIGIAPSDQQKLFKSFCQLDASPSKKFGGAGLGLAISRELAACMGGDIELRSRKGKGCVFTFSAEFTSGAPVIPSPPEEEADRTGSPLRILLAEDNPVNSAYLVRFLRAEGHSVIVAKNGIEALEALGKERFDIVLMDVQMPQMDGVEATRRIRSARPEEINTQIPVIALTAYAMKGDRETFLQAGMNDYVPKPVDFNQLRSILSKFTATQGCS